MGKTMYYFSDLLLHIYSSEEWKFPESEMGNIEPLEVKDDGEFW